MKTCPDTYYVVVIEDSETGQIIGSATLVKEQKFIHSASSVSWNFCPEFFSMEFLSLVF